MGEPDRERGVDPTVRWLMRGVWTAAFVVFVIFLVSALVSLSR